MMFAAAKKFLAEFYERNLFERIIIYLFLSAFIAKIVFELILGQWAFVQAQNKQWIFYGFLALDYLLTVKKVINIRVTVNPFSIFAFFIFIWIAQGVFVGLAMHNSTFKLFNDTVPLLMIALNILRMQSSYEICRPIDTDFLLKICTLLSLGTCLFGLMAKSLGKPADAIIGVDSVYFPLFAAVVLTQKKTPAWLIGAMLFMTMLSISDLNRTTLAFFAIVAAATSLLHTIKNPVRGLTIIFALVLLFAAGMTFLPKDSKTYVRITDIASLDLGSRKGSVGERQAEMDAVQNKIDQMGKMNQWLGLGFGGVYDVARTHEFLHDQGHAHYSWAWFNLRFGRVGYFYLFVMVSVLAFNIYSGFRDRTTTGLFLALLCFISLLYCMTYVNAIYLMSGITFFSLAADRKVRAGPGRPA